MNLINFLNTSPLIRRIILIHLVICVNRGGLTVIYVCAGLQLTNLVHGRHSLDRLLHFRSWQIFGHLHDTNFMMICGAEEPVITVDHSDSGVQFTHGHLVVV